MCFIRLLVTGWSRHKQAGVNTRPPPPISRPEPKTEAPPTKSEATPEQPAEPAETIPVPSNARAISEETGIASWYGAPYHNRRGSNGEIYNMHSMTAAHPTLPLGSVVPLPNHKPGR